MTFETLNLIPQILHSLKGKGYLTPTPIQEKSILHILEGKDIIGSAQTGTGKTAAFALPILQMLFTTKATQRKGIKTLVLAPTRELAQQISDSFRDYGRGLHLRHAVIYGGVSQRPQTDALCSGVDILIATPGRLLDLMNQGYVRLENIEFFVLDEVDRMLDMGFINDIKKIITRIPEKRQTVFFSATMPAEIKKLSDTLLHHPVHVQVNPPSSTAINVKQYMYFVQRDLKKALLKNILEKEPKHHTLVFTRTKRGADKLVKSLLADGMKAESIHGDKSQGARQRALAQFKTRKINLLVATDVASRGLDITDITHVINFDLPEEAEVYVHRIGRTGRAGAMGIAISFCGHDERYMMKDINKLSGNKIELVATPTLSHSETRQHASHDKPRIYFSSDGHHREGHSSRHGHSRHRERSLTGGHTSHSERRFPPRHSENNHAESNGNSGNGHSSQPERKFIPRKKKWHGKWQGKRSSHRPSR